MSTLFGTDGIRGRANQDSMSPETLMAIGKAAGIVASETCAAPRVVIGKDTRLSGYMVESALTAGLVSVGAMPILLGPLPTPAVSMLTHSLRADLGIMITASHNPYYDNGVKFFRANGCKLCDDTETRIEKLVAKGINPKMISDVELGQASRLEGAQGRYTESVKNTVPKGLKLGGLKIVLDCANGAGYKVAPEILWELGAEVIPIGVRPDGVNINHQCGATDTRAMRSKVISEGADIGIALDGDADRIIVCDEKGQMIDGDQILALIAEVWNDQGRLNGNGVAATVMSNMGLEKHLSGLGLELHRTDVGDRHVVKCMQEKGLNLGGEQSGHIVLADYACTGDGLVAGLQVLTALVEKQTTSSQLCSVFKPFPQTMRNVPVDLGNPLAKSPVIKAIAAAETHLGTSGRVLVRASGTEPLVRVMAEGEDVGAIERVANGLAQTISEAA
jgi:phosphoglucosamine mutase